MPDRVIMSPRIVYKSYYPCPKTPESYQLLAERHQGGLTKTCQIKSQNNIWRILWVALDTFC